MGHAALGSKCFVAATEKLRVRALSYKAVFSIRATKQLSNKSWQCAPSLILSRAILITLLQTLNESTQ
jgi:hypothetical protein